MTHLARLRDEIADLKFTLSRVHAHPALLDVADERVRQIEKHGDQSHLPDGTGEQWHWLADWTRARCKSASQNEGGDGTITWEHIITEEWAETLAESDHASLRAELVQVAAVAVAWIEAIDGRTAKAEP